MQSVDMEYVENSLASFQELHRSHAALQKLMADFEAMATDKFESYKAELSNKDIVIASLKAKIAKLEAELENTRRKIRQTVEIAACLHPRTGLRLHTRAKQRRSLTRSKVCHHGTGELAYPCRLIMREGIKQIHYIQGTFLHNPLRIYYTYHPKIPPKT